METMTNHHGFVGVEDGGDRKDTEVALRIFCCSVFRDRATGIPVEERSLKRKPFHDEGVTQQEEHPRSDGGVAQLGEHLPCKQGVMGSIPIISTIF